MVNVGNQFRATELVSVDLSVAWIILWQKLQIIASKVYTGKLLKM